jgi:Na+/glutamate symporter
VCLGFLFTLNSAINKFKECFTMSGKTPLVGGLGGGAGIALLPNTGGTRVMFWVAAAALAVGLVALAISGAVAIKNRVTR